MSKFIIPIQVKDEQELYSRLDPSGLSFSSELTDYLSDSIEDRRLGEGVSIELSAAYPPDMERFKTAYLMYLTKQLERNKKEMAKSRVNALRLLSIGIAFILIGIIFSAFLNEVIAAIISTIGSFSVWEASAVWIETLPKLRKRERLLQMLMKADIEYRRGE